MTLTTAAKLSLSISTRQHGFHASPGVTLWELCPLCRHQVAGGSSIRSLDDAMFHHLDCYCERVER